MQDQRLPQVQATEASNEAHAASSLPPPSTPLVLQAQKLPPESSNEASNKSSLPTPPVPPLKSGEHLGGFPSPPQPSDCGCPGSHMQPVQRPQAPIRMEQHACTPTAPPHTPAAPGMAPLCGHMKDTTKNSSSGSVIATTEPTAQPLCGTKDNHSNNTDDNVSNGAGTVTATSGPTVQLYDRFLSMTTASSSATIDTSFVPDHSMSNTSTTAPTPNLKSNTNVVTNSSVSRSPVATAATPMHAHAAVAAEKAHSRSVDVYVPPASGAIVAAQGACGADTVDATIAKPPVDTFDLSYSDCGALLAPPARNASIEDKMDFLHQQLDSIGTEREILNGLVSLGSGGHDRLQGGVVFVVMVLYLDAVR